MNTTHHFALNDTVSQELAFLQGGYGQALIDGIDAVIDLLLDQRDDMPCEDSMLLNHLYTLNNTRTSLRHLLHGVKEEGGEQ